MRSYLAALALLVGCGGKIAGSVPFADTSVECTTPPDAATACALCVDGWHCPTGLLQQCPPGIALGPTQSRTETGRVVATTYDCFSCVDGSGTEFSVGKNLAGELVTVAPVAQFPCSP
jgi:hypothetical protein